MGIGVAVAVGGGGGGAVGARVGEGIVGGWDSVGGGLLAHDMIISEVRATRTAMAAGLANNVRSMEWLIGLVDANAPEPGSRGPYKKRQETG